MNNPLQAEPRRSLGRPRTLLVIIAFAALFAILLMPSHPRNFGWSAFTRLPLELPLALCLLLFVNGIWARALRIGIVLAAGTLLLLRLADIGSYFAFNRRFNPAVELHLLGDGWNLVSASIGRTEAAIIVSLVLFGFALLLLLVYRGLAALELLRGPARRQVASLALLILVTGAAVLVHDQSTDEKERHYRVQADLRSDIVDRTTRMQRSFRDQRLFVEKLKLDPVPSGTIPLFDALSGRDVVLIFVESYGRSFLDGERFRGPARERLATMAGQIARAGLHARSGWLTSPIRGGRSWLAHATFSSGLTIGSMARFDRLVVSPRRSLTRVFGEAGWRTAGIMPAIQYDWPEGSWYGFDDTREARDLQYAGEDLGWVTMPDQYTLEAFERLVRRPTSDQDTRPVMAKIALISSHAPWTPVSTIVPWEDLGDGAIFDGSHRFGPAPSEMWKEREQVREQYALSLDYTLEVLGGYLERYGDGALILLVGDHQPPSIINGWDATADVPIHLVSDDPALLDRLPRELWSDGMLPADDLPSQPMASMRSSLVRHFSTLDANGREE